MKQDFTKTPIFITGIERSGSSIIARIISSSGAFAGPVTEMYENTGMKTIMGDYYFSNGYDPAGQFPLPGTDQLLIPTNWGNTVKETLSSQKYKEDKPWMFKSFKLAQTWPLWNYAYPNAKWIIVRRRTGDIIQSCVKTGFMRAFKSEEIQKQVHANTETEGWLWWVHEHEKRFVEMMEAGLNVKTVWPERMVYGDYQQIYEMLEWVGLNWHDGIVDLVSPLLKHSTLKERRNER